MSSPPPSTQPPSWFTSLNLTQVASTVTSVASTVASSASKLEIPSQLTSLKDAASSLKDSLSSPPPSTEPFLNIPSLNSLSLTYITSHLLTCSYPHPPLSLSLHHLLLLRHPNHIIYNLSETPYPPSTPLSNYVECTFPGHPCPGLKLMAVMCMSWGDFFKGTEEGTDKVLVVHCLTGGGRTITSIVSLLTYTLTFPSTSSSLTYVLSLLKKTKKKDILPTQHRYMGYIDKLLNGVYPSTRERGLRKITCMNVRSTFNNNMRGRCYLQIFKDSKCLRTIKAEEEGEVWENDGCTFRMEEFWVKGDVLIRLRHVHPETKVRETVWRVGFHVGYVNVGREGGGIRLGKESLDGGRGEESVTLEFGGERGGEDEEEKETFKEFNRRKGGGGIGNIRKVKKKKEFNIGGSAASQQQPPVSSQIEIGGGKEEEEADELMEMMREVGIKDSESADEDEEDDEEEEDVESNVEQEVKVEQPPPAPAPEPVPVEVESEIEVEQPPTTTTTSTTQPPPSPIVNTPPQPPPAGSDSDSDSSLLNKISNITSQQSESESDSDLGDLDELESYFKS
ncbi:hypothetical protein TrST_g8855 [Triparma strigata]|uniref:Uncharacterized protein n=1 Tax=Triparma strigata TaxID=1606541 RepID=A0A9W7BUB4_9STRA|nr:hypothetical protein TrST_g8855 [Triparma strigata]